MVRNNNYIVIMAGGVGSRFWPFSRTNNPKQFHDVMGTGRTMLQETVDRFEGFCPKENILIVTHKDYEPLVKRDLPDFALSQILLEPVRRNTAPCIAYACYKIGQLNADANIVVCPSDHVVTKTEEFRQTIKQGLHEVTGKDILLTLGIQPNRPDTGYGYIQYLEANAPSKKVKTFTEKPELELAQKFLESGDFVWNSGIFLWNYKAIKSAFESFLPEMAEQFEKGLNHLNTSNENQFIESVYAQCTNISIDFGVMEKADNVYVLLSNFGWSDLGTWKSLYEISKKDEHQNVIDGNALTFDTQNCIIKISPDKLLVVNGLENFIIAEYDGVTMICPIEEEQRVKEFVAAAKDFKGQKFI